MNRRSFIKFLGAFAAAATLPDFPAHAKIAESKRFLLNDFVLFECSPLPAGSHTVTWFAGDDGIFVGGLEATGGETLIKFWTQKNAIVDRPAIKLGGVITMTWQSYYDFTDPETQDRMVRGDRLEIK